MKLMFLGCGEAFDRIHSVSMLVDEKILLECGPHTLRQLMKEGIDIRKIDLIFLSHLHADHSAGIPFLLLASAEEGRSRELRIIGPEGTKDFVNRSLHMAYRKSLENLPFEVNVEEIGDRNLSMEILGYRFHFGRTKHSVPCYSISIEKHKKKITYTGDGEPTKETFLIAKGSHILISEAYGEGFEMHSSPYKAAELAKASGSKLLILVHIHRKCLFEEVEKATSIFSPILLPREFETVII